MLEVINQRPKLIIRGRVSNLYESLHHKNNGGQDNKRRLYVQVLRPCWNISRLAGHRVYFLQPRMPDRAHNLSRPVSGFSQIFQIITEWSRKHSSITAKRVSRRNFEIHFAGVFRALRGGLINHTRIKEQFSRRWISLPCYPAGDKEYL